MKYPKLIIKNKIMLNMNPHEFNVRCPSQFIIIIKSKSKLRVLTLSKNIS